MKCWIEEQQFKNIKTISTYKNTSNVKVVYNYRRKATAQSTSRFYENSKPNQQTSNRQTLVHVHKVRTYKPVTEGEVCYELKHMKYLAKNRC